MSNQFFDKPILNSPHVVPARHWELDKEGQPTQRVMRDRRKAVVSPYGSLFSMIKAGAFRKKFLCMAPLDSVTGLNLIVFCGTDPAACVLVFRPKKAKDKRIKMPLVNASKEFITGRSQNDFFAERVDRIHGRICDYADVVGLAGLATLEETVATDNNINLEGYDDRIVTTKDPTEDEPLRCLSGSADAVFTAENRLVIFLAKRDCSLKNRFVASC